MKKNFTIIGVFVLVAALYAWGSRPADPTKSAPRWEFKRITATTMTIDGSRFPQDDPPDVAKWKEFLKTMVDQAERAKKGFDTDLKVAGASGWELVAVTVEPESITGLGIGANTMSAFMKRPAK